MVADDFGRIGRAWREANYEGTDHETVLLDMLSDQYTCPIRIIAFSRAYRGGNESPPPQIAGAIKAVSGLVDVQTL